jgi:hypothetical protein
MQIAGRILFEKTSQENKEASDELYSQTLRAAP